MKIRPRLLDELHRFVAGRRAVHPVTVAAQDPRDGFNVRRHIVGHEHAGLAIDNAVSMFLATILSHEAHTLRGL